MQMDGVSAVAAILVASFGIDRVVTGLLFLLSYIPAFERRFPEPPSLERSGSHQHSNRSWRLVYTVVAGGLSILVVWCLDLRIFEAIGFKPSSVDSNDVDRAAIIGRQTLDGLFTALILVGGADRIAALLRIPGRHKGAPEPVEIKGRIVLDDAKA